MRLFPRRNRSGVPEPVRALIALEGSQIGIDGTGRIRHGVVIESIPEIQVKHIIERKIPPRPTVITAILRGINDVEFRTNPINTTLRHTVPVQFPLGAITGRMEDYGTYCLLTLELHYDPRT